MFFRKKCLDDPMVVRLDPFIAISKEDGEQRNCFFPENGLMVGMYLMQPNWVIIHIDLKMSAILAQAWKMTQILGIFNVFSFIFFCSRF